MLGFSLRPEETMRAKNATAYEYMYAEYPFLRPWTDSLERAGALRDTVIVDPQGVRLHALYAAAPEPTDRTAVIVHGYTDCAVRMLMIGYLYNHDLRYNILLPDLHYHGRSEGRAIRMGWLDRLDVLRWMEVADTLFGGKMPAPSADTLKLLSNYVVDNGCNLGVATDGDADRLGVIDEKGAFLHPNTLLVLLYYYLLKYRGWSGPCVRNNSTSCLLDRVAAGLGQKCYEVPVGFKWVSAKMSETGAIIGGESSGGMAVRGHISGKDGIYAAALLVEMLAVTGKSVSELFAEITAQYGNPCWAEADFRMTPERKAELQKLLFTEKRVPEFVTAVDHISLEDGCKVYFTDGSWVICRFSGTEPLLRMAAEGESQSQARTYIRIWREELGL